MKHRPSPDSPQLFPLQEGPDFETERIYLSKGARHVAGTDEVGRGPLAGPVVAASVILDPESIPEGLDDSKKLSAKRRKALFTDILCGSMVSISIIPAAIIDQVNIRQATLLAMRNAISGLPVLPDIALVDGRDCPPDITCPSKSLIKGDTRSVSIAAASIVAKVTRDRMMVEAARLYPQYGFENHKGYGARTHMEAIAAHGPCPLHRMSFSPMRSV